MLSYEVWRQDDNGRRFRVAVWPTREGAEQQQRELERRGHKQTYEVVAVHFEGNCSDAAVSTGGSSS
jgi:hypothetical protein